MVSSITPGDVEDSILDCCASQDIHLLAMGAYCHSRISQFLVGSTTLILGTSNDIVAAVALTFHSCIWLMD
ncbi:universal stress protein [Cellvibrio sp. KY-GH-1]|uniref:universal stress protein n=1 Tax=Cellvibrio sp. KY-GH-1 TaxID=2303332 RepID=UPI0012482673|nr:universal stress protein [Cellvibrio sp. KY-GH-1]QEY15264.1 universal stress protein [Cellvibrio sp. KY-GH-1]